MNFRTEQYFLIADLRLLLLAEEMLLESRGFEPFKINGGEVDICIRLRQKEKLSLTESEKLFCGEGFDIIRTANGLARCYHEFQRPEKAYALRYRQDRSHVMIEYRKEAAAYFMEYRNCFYHMALEDLLLPFQRFVLHASYIRTKFGGLLFSGVSGVGKSTQADLWCRYLGADLVNGDKPIVGRLADGTWRAYGSPYAGSSRCYRNESDRVRAVIFLQQSPENSLRRLALNETFRRLYENTIVNSWNPEFVSEICDLLNGFSVEIPAYEFCCTPDLRAVRFLEQALERGESG